MKQLTKILLSMAILTLIAMAAACGGSQPAGSEMKSIHTKKTDDNLTVTLANDTGKLKNGKQELMLSFTDSTGAAAEISAATLNFNMPAMGSMAEMNDPAALTTTTTPGQFKGTVNIQMPGEWQAQITYEGKSGKGKVTYPLTAN